MAKASPTAAALLDRLAKAAPARAGSFVEIENLAPTREILASPPDLQREVVRECLGRIAALRPRPGDGPQLLQLIASGRYPLASSLVVDEILRRPPPMTEAQLADLIGIGLQADYHLTPLLTAAKDLVKKTGAGAPLRTVLGSVAAAYTQSGHWQHRELAVQVQALIADLDPLPLERGEAWSDAVHETVASLSAKEQSAWQALIRHCTKKWGGSPPKSWRARSMELVSEIGAARFRKQMLTWLPLVDQPRTGPGSFPQWHPHPELLITDRNQDVLKGLVWCCTLSGDRDIARALGTVAQSAYKKLPGIGPRAPRIGNSCVMALGEMPGMEGAAELAVLKVRVKFGTAQKLVEKSVTATAARVGMSREDIEELGVPDYGLTDIGRVTRPVGDVTAELVISGPSQVEVRCIKKDGTVLKTIPAAAKRSVTALKAVAKDLGRMLPAQRERIDRLHLAKKSWPVDVWRERYLDHPLIGVLGRRLLWRFRSGDRVTDVLFHRDRLVTIDGKPLGEVHQDTTVELWHPIGVKTDQVVAWRRLLEKLEIRQPFKQAHRELYLLTDAERSTGTYSNRFAAHVVKQHQFNALCATRGWKNVLKLLVDQDFPPPSLAIPAWGLRAEFWTEGAGDNYGTDTNDTGTFLRLTTDQVRFYPLETPRTEDRTPLRLEDVPPIVFSEVLRDVDLFVGVASVGNDPTWADGGPQGRYRDYWRAYSFGELSATAATRKDVLQGIVPRLAIAGRCSFVDRFLVVKGDLRTYKIHLGSGNILMTPNDQYLCIVPDRGAAAERGEKVFLPFEGDTLLSLILSKALLLADDTHIGDPTILSQIQSAAT